MSDHRKTHARRPDQADRSARARATGRTLLSAAALAAGAAFYGSVIERNAFAVRRLTVPVLDPGTPVLRLLHISDLHLLPRQRRKQAFIRSLADLRPDLVLNTGDTLSDPRAIPALLSALGPLLELPGGFVPGNNDYYLPQFKTPLSYFLPHRPLPVARPRMPWAELSRAMSSAGWIDLTHQRAALEVAGVRVAVTGTDDAHLRRARYEQVTGPADPSAAVRIAVTHSPEPSLLDRFAADGYDLAVAGHTHGGQVRVPFGPAIVTNCDLDVWRARGLCDWNGMALNVSAGLGTGPYAPIRIACRPEVSLLTLVPRDSVA
jgi:predicted MPP superfamily phosphohydrolase